MPVLDLTNANNQYLVQSGFSVEDIEKSPTLVGLLNRFHGKLIIDNQDKGTGIGAKSYGNTIHISKSYNNFLNIAHELGHATGQYQQINRDSNNLYRFDNASNYAMARAKAEGEATYYEFLVAKELGYNHFVKPLWLDNMSKPKDYDVFKQVDEIMSAEHTDNEKIMALAVLNQAMLPSGQVHTPLYTYDEYNTLVFLNNRFSVSRISQDYQQAFAKAFDWNSYPAKSLANKANQHYGTLGDDVIINHHIGGSVLGQQGEGDLLWGSQGKDILVGNTGKDTLLGGADDDLLIGDAGDDILVGGSGNDVYYFDKGFGHDTIINAGGGKDIIYLADKNYADLTLVSQENNDLTLDFAKNQQDKLEPVKAAINDRITLKKFYLTDDNASLAIKFANSQMMPVSQLTSLAQTPQTDMTDYEQTLQQTLNRLAKMTLNQPLN